MNIVNIFAGALQELINQLMALVPQLVISWIIWWGGNKLLKMGINLLRRIDIPKTQIDIKIIESLIKIVLPVGKVVLVLIILDYLGIGRSIITAVTTGLTLMVAIALGISFGKALEPEAQEAVKTFKKHFKK